MCIAPLDLLNQTLSYLFLKKKKKLYPFSYLLFFFFFGLKPWWSISHNVELGT